MKPGWLALAIATQLAASAFDLATTRQCLQSGRGREANPVMAGGRGVGVKVAASVTLTGWSWHLRSQRPKMALAMNVAPAVAYTAAGLRNRAVCR